MEIITELNYEHAENIWKEFSLKIYHDSFVKNDTLLLPDIFENLGDNVLIYTTWYCPYYTSPGLSWQAVSEVTKVELELLTDAGILLN